MTVGVAAVAEAETDDPKVVISSDRLLTTQQLSAIEHEHPETKISEIGTFLDGTNLLSVTAGGIEIGEEYRENYLEEYLRQWTSNEEREPTVPEAADLAGQAYRTLMQNKIEEIVLSPYGLQQDDLSRQHQFKDEFLNDVLAEARQVRDAIQDRLVVLLGGVDQRGAYVYEISNNDVRGHNEIGYATIGSGTQPAQSEFIKADYGKRKELEDTLAIVAAANHQADRARGVGGDTDIGVVTSTAVNFIDENTVDGLMERQNEIANEQESVRTEILSENQIQWEGGK